MKILIAEDEFVSRKLLETTLRKTGYEVQVACDGTAAWELLQADDPPQLAILDWMMPGMDGLEICQRVRNRANQSYIYILLLTAKSDKRDIIAGLEAGADDYLTKPFDAYELRARLNVGRRILELQQQYIAVCEELRIRATHDGLTGAWNRVAILEHLDLELARARREGTSLGVVMVDLDHFKKINDTYGHPAGDAVLREASRVLREGLRPYDMLGRYGGEEFLMLAPSCDVTSTAAIAERLRILIAETPVHFGGVPIAMSASLGITAYENGSGANAKALLHTADEALYRAKRGGRNRVEIGAPPMLPHLTGSDRVPCGAG